MIRLPTSQWSPVLETGTIDAHVAVQLGQVPSQWSPVLETGTIAILAYISGSLGEVSMESGLRDRNNVMSSTSLMTAD